MLGLRRLLKEALGGAGTPDLLASRAVPAEGSLEATLLADLCDDLNTPKALATLWTALRNPALDAKAKVALGAFAEGILSVGLFDFARLEPSAREVPEAVRNLAEQRWAARQAKDFAASDRLRDELLRQGYVVKDRKDGYHLTPAE